MHVELPADRLLLVCGALLAIGTLSVGLAQRVRAPSMLLFLGAGATWAQGTIYSWTDEKGVVHFSNSMIPPQHAENATKLEPSSRPPDAASGTDTANSIPLVILNDDPSQKFVRAEVINWQELLNAGSYGLAREKGLIRTEGKEYVVKDGDIIEFKI